MLRAPSEFAIKLIETKLTEYCERRIPIDICDQVNLTFKIMRDKVTLIETRPYFRDPSIWYENLVSVISARLTDENSLPLIDLFRHEAGYSGDKVMRAMILS